MIAGKRVTPVNRNVIQSLDGQMNVIVDQCLFGEVHAQPSLLQVAVHVILMNEFLEPAEERLGNLLISETTLDDGVQIEGDGFVDRHGLRYQSIALKVQK